MFSGIVQNTASVLEVENKSKGISLVVEADFDYCAWISIGDSISVNGCCLTVVENSSGKLKFDLSEETMNCTSFSGVKLGDVVNLEKSLKLEDSLDGHLVSGHVDSVSVLLDNKDIGDSRYMKFSCDKEYLKFIAVKGSITINGVSLTVNEVLENSFTIMLIPHTLVVTNLSSLTEGDKVNLEVDLIARYVARQLAMVKINENNLEVME